MLWEVFIRVASFTIQDYQREKDYMDSLGKLHKTHFRHLSVWLHFWLRYQAIISNLLTSFQELAPNPDIFKTIVNIQQTLMLIQTMNVTHKKGVPKKQKYLRSLSSFGMFCYYSI